MFVVFYFTLFYLALFGMIFAKSPQRRLLCMILILLNYVFSFVYVHLEYLAFIILIVYIGAISVLFLFMIMLVSVVKVAAYSRNLFLFVIVFLLSLFLFCLFVLEDFSFWFTFNFFFDNLKDSLLSVDNTYTPFSDVFGVMFSFLDDTVFFEVLDLLLENVELEQLGLMFWTSCIVYIVLAAVLLVVSIVGCVLVLKDLIRSNLTKKSFLKKV